VAPARHRGKSPQKVAFFTRSHRTREEAALIVSLCCLVGVLPEIPASELAKSLHSLGRAELLWQAYGVRRECCCLFSCWFHSQAEKFNTL